MDDLDSFLDGFQKSYLMDSGKASSVFGQIRLLSSEKIHYIYHLSL